MPRTQSRSGWTLLEVVVLLGILAVIFGLMLPALAHVRERAGNATCLNNLRQLALAAHSHNIAENCLPEYATDIGSWWIRLMPHADHGNIHGRIMQEPADTSLGHSATWQDGVRDARFPILLCPAAPVSNLDYWGATNYLANWYVFGDGIRGCFTEAQRLATLSDGLSETVLFAEAYGQCGELPRRALTSCEFHNFGITADYLPSDHPSYDPDFTMFQVRPNVCDWNRVQTPHAAMNVALADGSARAIAADVAPDIWKSMLQPRDGGVIALP